MRTVRSTARLLVVALAFASASSRAAEDVQPTPPRPDTPVTPRPTVKPELPGGHAEREMPRQDGTSAVVMDLSAIDSVIGKSVKSEGGEDLGHVVDLLVTTSGQVRAAVLDFGGVLGVGTRKIAVDWKALEFANVAKDGVVRLALTRNQVRVAPEYKPGDPVVIIEAPRNDEQRAAGQPKAPAASGVVSTPQGGAATK